MTADAQGFNPAAAWSFEEVQTKARLFRRSPDPKIIALVTTSGQFYSILMLKLQADPQEPSIQLGRDWCVAGLKTVQPMNRDALYMEMRKLSDS
jgi:pectin methylesterase-like acyl-CoA thioesterase